MIEWQHPSCCVARLQQPTPPPHEPHLLSGPLCAATEYMSAIFAHPSGYNKGLGWVLTHVLARPTANAPPD